MAKKKSGHVAIPFLIALLLGIVGIGGVAMFVFQRISYQEPDVKEMQTSVVKPTAADNMTLLFVLDEEANPSLPTTFIVTRILPEDKKVIFFCFPSNMLAVVNGKNDTLANFYTNSGVQAVKDAIADQSSIQIDRYAVLDSEAFQKICNIFAGVYYQVPAGTGGFEDSAEPQYLGPAQMEKLITYPFYEQGEIQRSALAADVLADMVNQTDYKRIVSRMDTNFRTLVNMMDTDITSVDYGNEEHALKYMFNYGDMIASFRIVTGEAGENEDVFLLSSNFYHSVSELFEEESAPEETAASEPEA